LRVSELIDKLEIAKERHGDMQVIQNCSREGLSMNVLGVTVLVDSANEKKWLNLEDGGEHQFDGLPDEPVQSQVEEAKKTFYEYKNNEDEWIEG